MVGLQWIVMGEFIRSRNCRNSPCMNMVLMFMPEMDEMHSLCNQLLKDTFFSLCNWGTPRS